MRIVVQRVLRAAVEVDGSTVSSIGRGLVVLVGFAKGDTVEELSWMAKKLPSLRIFEDSEGKMNLSAEEAGGEILVVSQFTIYGDCRKGRRPGFERSAPVEEARKLYEDFVVLLERTTCCPVKAGLFREHMHVELVNDGPVTLVIEKESG